MNMKNPSRIPLLMTFLELLVLGSSAQDPHFTQIHEAPMAISPAYIGNYFGSRARVSANSRSQWVATANPYLTNSVSFDGKLITFDPNESADIHSLNVGFMLLNDRSLGGLFSRNSATLGVSYYQKLDEYGHHFLGIGFSGTYRKERVDYTSLTWGNQFSNGIFNASLPSGEPFYTNDPSFFTLASGLNYLVTNDDKTTVFEIGGSMYNVNRPEYGVYGDKVVRYPSRFSLHGMYSTYLSKSSEDGYNNQLHLRAIYQLQGNVNYAQIGARLDRNVIGNLYVGVGLWYRTPNALIPHLNLSFGDLSFDFTYDMSRSGYLRYNSVEFGMAYLLGGSGN